MEEARGAASSRDDGSSHTRKRRLSKTSNLPSNRRKMLKALSTDLQTTHAINETLEGTFAPISGTPIPDSKPGLTLLDLPTELRLEIYDYLFSDLLVHIYSRPTASRSRLYFSSSTCVQTDKDLLCQRPKWTLHDECCDFENPKAECKNRLAFVFTCKRIYQETETMLYSRPVFHISHAILMPFLTSIRRLQWTGYNELAIQNLTLTGPFMGGRRAVNNAADALSAASNLLPGLRRIAFQVPISIGLMAGNSLDPSPRWRKWHFSEVLLSLRKDGVQQILLETTAMMRGGEPRFVIFRVEQEAKDWRSDPDRLCITNYTSDLSHDSSRNTYVELRKHWLF